MAVIDALARKMGSALARLGVMLVDIVAPGLWEGKAFRVYKEFNANLVIRFTADTDFALDEQTLVVITGEARVEVMTGGTPGGSWTPIPTHFNKKLIGTPIAPTFLMDFGGTHTGGNEREVLMTATATGGNAAAAATHSQGKRLLPAGTYYMRIIVTGTTRGMWAVEYDKLG